MVKAHVPITVQGIADRCIQAHGAMGVSQDTPLFAAFGARRASTRAAAPVWPQSLPRARHLPYGRSPNQPRARAHTTARLAAQRARAACASLTGPTRCTCARRPPSSCACRSTRRSLRSATTPSTAPRSFAARPTRSRRTHSVCWTWRVGCDMCSIVS